MRNRRRARRPVHPAREQLLMRQAAQLVPVRDDHEPQHLLRHVQVALVHEERGGKSTKVPLSEEAKRLASVTNEATEKVLRRKLGYARLDLLRWQGKLVVSEVEITEPQLYFDRIPQHGELFAKMVARSIEEREKRC